MVLRNTTKIGFAIPRNTSLVVVHGPSQVISNVVANSYWDCSAAVEPLSTGPAGDGWWKPSRPGERLVWLAARQTTAQQVHNSTLFTLPIDPSVEFRLHLSAPQSTRCVISGVTTYPFDL